VLGAAATWAAARFTGKRTGRRVALGGELVADNPAQVNAPQSSAPHWRGLAREVAETALLTLLIFVVMRVSFQTFKVVGPSMQPGLQQLGPTQYEYLGVASFVYWFTPPHRGDVVVFYKHHIPHLPGDTQSLDQGCVLDPGSQGRFMTCEYVKRVIGIPGDTVRTTVTGVIVDGVTLSEPYVAVPPGGMQSLPFQVKKWTLGANNYLVMGDNRVNSDDSRDFGPILRRDIIGPAFMIFWPLGQMHWLPSYASVFAHVKLAVATSSPFAIILIVVLVVLLLALGLLLLASYRTARTLLTPVRKPLAVTPADVGLALDDLWIVGPRGNLAAWYLPARNGCTLICCHGINDNRGQWLGQVARLHRERGYGALLFDFAGHGQSDGNLVTYGVREADDLAAVVEYLRARGDVDMGRLGVMGYSLGAITAVLAAARMPELRVVVIESGFADVQRDVGVLFQRYTGLPRFPLANLAVFWGQRIGHVQLSHVRPAQVIGRIAPRGVFIISDLKDALADEPHDGEQLYANAGDPKRLWQVPDVEHVQAFTVYPDEWITRVESFLDQYLAEKPGPHHA
jgi:signal peptidase I